MNKEQIIDEVYGKYADSHEYFVDGWLHVIPMFHNKETFVNECKTNPEFSEKWGLKIEERELSDKEREILLEQTGRVYQGVLVSKAKNYKSSKKIFEVIKQTCDEFNIPTKLITLTYNNEKIESYE